MPARLTRGKIEKSANKQPWDPNKKFQPQFRKAIPKRTTSCRTLEAMKPKVGTKFLNEDIDMGHGFIQPGTIKASDAFNSFIKTKNKLLVVSHNFQGCSYNYWSMKALRAELQQPEAYLRETLENSFFGKDWSICNTMVTEAENKLNNYEGAGDAIAQAMTQTLAMMTKMTTKMSNLRTSDIVSNFMVDIWEAFGMALDSNMIVQKDIG
ncbi:hypothetical protein DID88_005909 [Monilinia fructigena]|uniref:TFIIF beta subunit HTH domain-containing protein n=1 Tax=Monilinia fructigena TaxID=38457 RepID=A0A395J284_9HELO|nr:hypothetical protein DID88_005909 [Monilinia fructigena]